MKVGEFVGFLLQGIFESCETLTPPPIGTQLLQSPASEAFRGLGTTSFVRDRIPESDIYATRLPGFRDPPKHRHWSSHHRPRREQPIPSFPGWDLTSQHVLVSLLDWLADRKHVVPAWQSGLFILEAGWGGSTQGGVDDLYSLHC